MHHCQIADCGAPLLGFDYFVVVLDNDRGVTICRPCMRKINAERRRCGLPPAPSKTLPADVLDEQQRKGELG